MSQGLRSGTLEKKIEVWTDGACFPNPGRGGWAWVTRCGNQGFGSEPETTNQRMELKAGLDALEVLSEEFEEVHIRTDSQFLVKGCTLWMPNWKKRGWRKADGKPVLHQDLWGALDVAMKKCRAKFSWVKGHSGDPMNERADQLAGMASGVPPSEIKRYEEKYNSMRFGRR